MAFHIITDSASDVPESIIKEYNLYVMPTPVTIEGTDYFDGKTIFPDQFYEIQASGKEIKTYHINQYMFHEHFLPYAQRVDEVLYICFSTGIAGTFNAANLAYEEVKEEYPDFKLTIIDSRCASVGYGLVVARLLKMQKNGAPKDLIIEAAHFFCEHMEHAVTVMELEYLFKGGRLSKTSFLAGTVLDIKPIIIVDENGSLKAVEKVRGWKKAQNRILDMVGEKGKNLENQV
ncbi:MAG: DegV family protein, partial [Lachnospiraceae bacterium]|nr:DegV family protein [Lachnospiraceae bacterium]